MIVTYEKQFRSIRSFSLEDVSGLYGDGDDCPPGSLIICREEYDPRPDMLGIVVSNDDDAITVMWSS